MEQGLEDWRHGGFGLYIHWPFCQSKCPYCDFNSHVAAAVDTARWTRCLLSEMRRVAREVPGRVLNSIFFGGGTPSLMEPALVAALVEEARTLWTPANDLEVTLEANPGSIEVGRFRDFHAGGVNRVSMGIQALRDGDLRRLGRRHTVRDALRGLDVARDVFDRVSFDLIYGRQDQTLADWQTELGEALALRPGHLSLYCLTIEDGTVFGARRDRGQLRGLPDGDLAADLFEVTQDLCGAAGLPAYEISNHAVPGGECRHNMIYWNGGDYAGIGPGAHGRLTLAHERVATVCERMPAAWLDQAERGSVEVSREVLSAWDRGAEYLMMGLRTRDGIDVDRFQQLSGFDLPRGEVVHLTDMGLLERRGDMLRTTGRGRILLDAILARLVSDQDSGSGSMRDSVRQSASSCSSVL